MSKKPKKVLWIEDERYSMQEYREALLSNCPGEKRHSWGVHCVTNASKAYQMLCCQERRFNAIVIDILPSENDAESDEPARPAALRLLTAIIEDLGENAPPVVASVCTAEEALHDDLARLRPTVVEVLVKPFTADAMGKALEKAAGKFG